MIASQLLVPVRTCQVLSGQFQWPKDARLAAAEKEDRLPLGQLAADLKAAGVLARLAGRAGAALRIVRDDAVTHGEAYVLSIGADGVEIRSRTAAGAYYAVQTLRDLVALHGRRPLPALRIEDEPDLARRAVYHDCSRGKVPTVATLCRLVEQLARWKINELQLYVENVFTFRKHPAIGRGFSPFTPDDIRKLQAHCAKHHVRFVGSLSSFGHLEKVLMLPQYQELAELAGIGEMGHKGTICPTDPRSIQLISEMYDEFVPLFDAVDFNSCCDETWDLGKGRSAEAAAKVGAGTLYLEFILKLRELCLRHGKRINIWGDIILMHPELLGRLPKDIVMLNWDYHADGKRIDRTDEFVRAGLPLMCCPGTNGWQSHGTRLGVANDNIIKFARIAKESRAEGLLNTDWGDFGHRNTLGVSLHGFALGAACSWGAVEALGDFTRRFTRLTFGDKAGKLAAFLVVIGFSPGTKAYHALVEPFDPGMHLIGGGGRPIGRPDLNVQACAANADRLAWLQMPRLKAPDAFLATALEEFELARRMDELGLRRLVLGRAWREVKPVSGAQLRKLADGMEAMSAEFARLWLARSRPSRLRDNLAAIDYVIREARALA